MTTKQRRIPAWIVIAIGTVITGAGLLWSSTLYDERGNELLDGPTATVLVALLGVVGTVLTLLLQKQKHVEHELKPNSGSSARDAIDRTEALAREAKATAARTEALAKKAIATAEHAARSARKASTDTEQLREDVQGIRKDLTGTATDIRGIRGDIGRLADAITNDKEKP